MHPKYCFFSVNSQNLIIGDDDTDNDFSNDDANDVDFDVLVNESDVDTLDADFYGTDPKEFVTLAGVLETNRLEKLANKKNQCDVAPIESGVENVAKSTENGDSRLNKWIESQHKKNVTVNDKATSSVSKSQLSNRAAKPSVSESDLLLPDYEYEHPEDDETEIDR